MNPNLNNEVDGDDNSILTEDSITTEKIIYLKNKIINLSKNDMIEVFKIIKNNNGIYTENKNGIFINMNRLTLSTIRDIENLLKFLSDKKNNFEQDIVIRKNIKELVENVVVSSNLTNVLEFGDQVTRNQESYKEPVSDIEEDYTKNNSSKKIDFKNNYPKSNELSFSKISVPVNFNQLQYKMLGLNKKT